MKHKWLCWGCEDEELDQIVIYRTRELFARFAYGLKHNLQMQF